MARTKHLVHAGHRREHALSCTVAAAERHRRRRPRLSLHRLRHRRACLSGPALPSSSAPVLEACRLRSFACVEFGRDRGLEEVAIGRLRRALLGGVGRFLALPGAAVAAGSRPPRDQLEDRGRCDCASRPDRGAGLGGAALYGVAGQRGGAIDATRPWIAPLLGVAAIGLASWAAASLLP